MKQRKTEQSQKDKFNVNDLHLGHPRIRAEDFRSPLIRRLADEDNYTDGEKTLHCSYRSSESLLSENPLTLAWSDLKDDHDRCINTYQSPVITELATLGLACIIVHQSADREITEVTRRGEKADYWLGQREEMLSSNIL